MIDAYQISFKIDDKVILNNVSVQAGQGEVLAVLGPNGAGKSSLLKIMTGLQRPTDGSVSLNGKSVDGYSVNALARVRAVLSQSTPISFPFSVEEIILMGRSPHLVDRESHGDFLIVDEILTRLDAHSLKKRMFSTLSGGEQQRIQFARVLAQIWDQEQANLFLDEPNTGLDLKQQLKIIEIVKELAVERGYSVFIILHDLQLARHYADRILLLKSGSVVSCGPSRDVLQPEVIADTYDIPKDYAARMCFRGQS